MDSLPTLPQSARPWRLCAVVVAVVALLAVLQVSPVSAGYEHTCFLSDFDSQRQGMCGERLIRQVTDVCKLISKMRPNGIYKRSYPIEPEPAKSLEGIMLTKKSALSYLAKRQGASSIVCECCVHSCHITEIIQYC